MTAEQHINQIKEQWNLTSSVPSTTANALEDIINSIFGKAAQIGYELLQNADDAGELSQDGIEVKYYLLKKHLVVQHNGKHFDSDNIEALCLYGSSSKGSGSSKDSDKIGYKGIGFKSVFNISDKVWILSKDYTFRFDKSYWNTPMPWQIVPIYTQENEIPNEVLSSFDSSKVTFVLELKSELQETENYKEIMNSIAEALQKEQNLLFLRHVTNFEILYSSTSGEIVSYRRIEKTKQNHIVSLKKYEKNILKESSNWHISTFSIAIPEEITRTLTNLDKRVCPEKLKRAQNIDISFAAKLNQDNTIASVTKSPIFSYLPTKVIRDGLPFIVNSNFLLDESRTRLLELEWNFFLFREIGFHQLNWFKEMAQDERFRFEFTGLLVKYSDATKDNFNKNINKGIKKAQSEIAFVPILNSSELKKAPDTIIDQTGISYEIQEQQLVKDEFDTIHEIADPKIKKIDILLKVDAKEFNHQKLRVAIKKGNKFNKVIDNIKLIDYFYKHINSITNKAEQDDWMQVLSETPFLLDNDNNLQEPPSLYFPKEKPELPFELSMTFLHEEIYLERVKDDKKLEDWLGQLKVAFPKPIEIIRNSIFPLIGGKSINHQNALPITMYIFQNRYTLERRDFDALKQLPLLTKGNSLREATRCYLSDEYSPDLLLEKHISTDIFVSTKYTNGIAELNAWKSFFLSLGSRQDMYLEQFDGPYSLIKSEFSNKYPSYIDYLQQHSDKSLFTIDTNLYSFLIPRYLEYSNSYTFALQYWDLLLNNRWNELEKKCRATKLKQGTKNISIPSYFEFLIQTNLYFPADDGNCYKSYEVYSQRLRDIIKTWGPISYFNLSATQEKLLGVRFNLSLDECMNILEFISKTTTSLDKEQITALYKYILNHFHQEEIQQIMKSHINLNLLAINNTFQPINKLQYLNLPKFAEKANSSDYIFINLDKNESIRFCDLLGIEVINEDNLELEHIPSINNNPSFITEWKLKLPYIAVISSSKRGNDYDAEYSRLDEMTRNTNFNPSTELSLILNKEEQIIYKKKISAWQDNNNVYYIYDWKDKRILFELIEILCNYFETKEIERELELILNLNKEDIYDWLEKQGFNTHYLLNLIHEDWQVNEPEITEDDKEINDKTKKIGLLGEQYVYVNDIIKQYYTRNDYVIQSITWKNEMGESSAPYDFEATLEDGSKHYWEVKSTLSETRTQFPISANEIQFALKNAESYFIIRLFNATQEDNIQYVILPNPIEQIKSGKIKINNAYMAIISEDFP